MLKALGWGCRFFLSELVHEKKINAQEVFHRETIRH